ncbi:MAG TPA: sigma-70 family RNA polymerase sigma factor [Gemmataceae bacterium]|jgi:RNA polymerase sigma factor (sigma-70 family)
MADTRHHPILNYLRRVLGAPTGGLTDAELLRRFVAERDEAAFELLLWRHAATVLHVCRQVLRDTDAVEDAFQATFLVFVRKAGSISRSELLGGWLHRVAYRVALKAREQIAKRKSLEQTTGNLDLSAAPDEADADLRELRQMICEEVNRLPARYRTPIVACFFEGKTHEETANQLGWPRGTVASRVARGRELLRRRLVRRGVALTGAALTSALASQASATALTGLIHVTLQTVKPMAGSVGLSPRAAVLAEGVLNAMYWTRVKIVTAVVLIAGVGGVGATFWGTPRSAAEPPSKRAPRAEAAAVEGDKADQPEDADKLTRDMAQSRLNLRKLVLAMHAYAEKNGHLPPPAIYDKKGKALLSWRVALLPYLEQNNLYKLFHLDEPWDSEHNKQLQETVVKVYAPVGKPDVPRSHTFYQVFVSSAPRAKGGGGGPAGGSGGADAPAFTGITAAFVKGQSLRFPAHIVDGTANTLLIVEAGNAVPWTKPEDLHYAADEPLPKLGGLFPNVFQAAFASGDVVVLTKKYDETNLRAAITSNGGEVIDMEQILAPRRGRARPPADEDAAVEAWWQKNENLRHELDRARENLRLLRAERSLQREQMDRNDKKDDPRLERLKRENARLQEELDKVRAESEALTKEISRRQKPVQRKGP